MLDAVRALEIGHGDEVITATVSVGVAQLVRTESVQDWLERPAGQLIRRERRPPTGQCQSAGQAAWHGERLVHHHVDDEDYLVIPVIVVQYFGIARRNRVRAVVKTDTRSGPGQMQRSNHAWRIR